MKTVLCGLAATMVLFVTSAASAAPTFAERMEAQKHAAEGKRMATQKEHKKAARAYEKADKLMPAPSYKLEIGRAYAELAELVKARDVLAECMAQSPVVQYTEKAAQKKCIELASAVDDRLPRLRVDVFKPEADKVSIEVDGDEYDPSEGELSMDVGEVEIVAKAKGYKTYKKTVKLAEGDRESIEISLEPAQKQLAQAEEEEDDGGGISPIPAYICWGLGAVGIGFGVGFGVAAINTTNEVVENYNCQDGECDAGAEDNLAVAKLNGNISTAGFVVGGAGVAAGTILFLFSGDDDDEGDEAEARPLLGPGYVGVSGKF